MKIKSFLIIAILLAVGGLGLWGLGGFSSAGSTDQAAEGNTSIFRVEGMDCSGCETGLKANVTSLNGIQNVEASYREGRVVVTYDAVKVRPEQIVAAIEELGYTAELQDAEGTPAAP